MQCTVSNPNLCKVTLGNFSWNVTNDYLDNTYRILMKHVGEAYLARYDRYFGGKRMEIMRHLKYLLDFKALTVYDERSCKSWFKSSKYCL